MRRITTIIVLSIVCLLSANTSESRAATVGIDFTRGVVVTARGGVPRTNGFEFTLGETKAVTALGFWDEGPTGPSSLNNSHDVTLWDVTGTELAAVVVDNSSQVIASTQTAGNWRFEDLVSPVILSPGSYVIGAGFSLPHDADRTNTDPQNPNSLIITSAPFLTVAQGRNGPGNEGTDVFPATGNSNIVLGPNLLFADVITVPEPACASLLLISLGAMVGRRTRTRA